MIRSNTPEFAPLPARPAALGIFAVLTLWALMPEARRLIDWRSGFSAISIVSILPLIALLVPFAVLVYGGGIPRIDRRFLTLAWIWLGGFSASLVVGIVSGNEISATLYSYATFCLPAVFGLWVASLDIERGELFETVARFLLALATPISLYAVAQLAYPPAWDVAWMQQARIPSIGLPVPFQFRPFSTLNGPAVFADFLVATILLNLPRLRKASPLTLMQIALCAGALALTSVRSGWLALALGIVCFLALGSNRLANLSAFAGVLLLFAAITTWLPSVIGSSNFGGGLGARLSTLTKLDSDVSYVERERYYGAPLAEAAQTPQGAGLGVIGTAAKLGDKGMTKDYDNGYIARFTEMGWFGFACYLATTLGALILTVRSRSALPPAIVASVAAVQLALIGSDVSSDHHSSLSGVFFWLSLALISRREQSA